MTNVSIYASICDLVCSMHIDQTTATTSDGDRICNEQNKRGKHELVYDTKTNIFRGKIICRMENAEKKTNKNKSLDAKLKRKLAWHFMIYNRMLC